MNKEDAIKYLQQLYPNGGHCWLDEQRIEAIGMAVKALQEEPISNPIDFEKELYKAFGQVKDFTLGMRIAKWFYDMGKNSQEPVSEDLEKAALLYYPKMSRISEPHDIIPADNESHYIGDANEDNRKAFKAGAEWKEKQMMAKAIDGTARPDDNEIWCNLTSNNLEDGDKVKVILIKED